MIRPGVGDPEISVIIPTFNRPRELRLCLEGFACQTAAAARFEVIVADDGSDQTIEKITESFHHRFSLSLERCDHAGASVARNLAIACSRAPLLLLYDDDLQPLPGMIEECLDFHARHPTDHELRLLYFSPAPEIADQAIVQWAFARLYPFPSAPGIHTWQYFWGGAITCKRALFAGRGFDPAYQAAEDAEFGLRAAAKRDLEIHFSPHLTGHFHRPLALTQICSRQFRMSFYRFQLARQYGVRFDHPAYQAPRDFVIGDWPSYRNLLLAARVQECSNLSQSPARFQLLTAMWLKAELHAMATGWLAAEAGGSPTPQLFD